MRATVWQMLLASVAAGCATVGCSADGCSARGAEAETALKCPKEAVLIPAGTFTMGYDGYRGSGAGIPEHEVTLTKPYCMDRTEVTQRAFYDCVASGRCPHSKETIRFRKHIAEQDPNWPAFFVNWEEARAYCRAQGGRLPTEAEWEFAARGTDGRLYPWGNESPTKAHWQHRQAGSRTKVGNVGAHSKGHSFFGLNDMSGNVQEWVSDHCQQYYDSEPVIDPSGPKRPDRGEPCRMARGSSWASGMAKARATTRAWGRPDTRDDQTGFRCAYDPQQ